MNEAIFYTEVPHPIDSLNALFFKPFFKILNLEFILKKSSFFNILFFKKDIFF